MKFVWLPGSDIQWQSKLNSRITLFRHVYLANVKSDLDTVTLKFNQNLAEGDLLVSFSVVLLT